MMSVAQATVAAQALLSEMPQVIHDALEHVTLHVVDCAPSGVPPHVKALWEGRQQLGDPDDDDDCDAGAWYDYNDDGELEMIEHGGGIQAEGRITLIAPNLANAEDVERALCHEIAHALGLDEWETAELGLE